MDRKNSTMAAEASSEMASNVQSGLVLSTTTRLTSPSISLNIRLRGAAQGKPNRIP
jgi:hypothetical protein